MLRLSSEHLQIDKYSLTLVIRVVFDSFNVVIVKFSDFLIKINKLI